MIEVHLLSRTKQCGALLYLRSVFCVDNLDEFRLKAGTTHEESVNIRFCAQRRCRLGVYATPVDDADLLRVQRQKEKPAGRILLVSSTKSQSS